MRGLGDSQGLWFSSGAPGLWGMLEEGPTWRHQVGCCQELSLGVRQQTQLSVMGHVGRYGSSLGHQVHICKMGIMLLTS